MKSNLFENLIKQRCMYILNIRFLKKFLATLILTKNFLLQFKHPTSNQIRQYLQMISCPLCMRTHFSLYVFLHDTIHIYIDEQIAEKLPITFPFYMRQTQHSLIKQFPSTNKVSVRDASSRNPPI